MTFHRQIMLREDWSRDPLKNQIYLGIQTTISRSGRLLLQKGQQVTQRLPRQIKTKKQITCKILTGKPQATSLLLTRPKVELLTMRLRIKWRKQTTMKKYRQENWRTLQFLKESTWLPYLWPQKARATSHRMIKPIKSCLRFCIKEVKI